MLLPKNSCKGFDVVDCSAFIAFEVLSIKACHCWKSSLDKISSSVFPSLFGILGLEILSQSSELHEFDIVNIEFSYSSSEYEFGFIGIIITIIYVSFIIKFLINLNLNLKKIKLRSKSGDDDFFKVFFCELIIFSYLVNFFIWLHA